jgi:hypothetical protein
MLFAVIFAVGKDATFETNKFSDWISPITFNVPVYILTLLVVPRVTISKLPETRLIVGIDYSF